MLKAIGYWKNEGATNLPSPDIFVGVYTNSELKSKIINYLNKGNTYVSWRGLSNCRFSCGTDSSKMGFRCFTDNIWVWPEGLSHYIDKHNVILPNEFIEHMAENSWTIPNINVEYTGREMYSYEFWYNYTKKHIMNKIRFRERSDPES